jgi:hypothetical protein
VLTLRLSILAILLASAATHASEVQFHPYTAPNVTSQEWETYHAKVSAALANTAEVRPAKHEVQYIDVATGTQYIFTTQGHPAHPAWIARRTRSYGGADYLDQVGGYAGSWKEWQAWFQKYRTQPALPAPLGATWRD